MALIIYFYWVQNEESSLHCGHINFIYLNLYFIDLSNNLANKYSTFLFLFHNVVHKCCKYTISIKVVYGISIFSLILVDLYNCNDNYFTNK